MGSLLSAKGHLNLYNIIYGLYKITDLKISCYRLIAFQVLTVFHRVYSMVHGPDDPQPWTTVFTLTSLPLLFLSNLLLEILFVSCSQNNFGI